jgi:ribosomal protein S18 acetylase RimI-like enzyme
MNYSLRLATTDDVQGLVNLEYELFPENNFNEKTLTNEILQGTTWVAYAGSTILGYCLCRMWDKTLIDILRLGVVEEARRAGIGTKLLQMALERAGDAMLTVRKGNDSAIRLYQKHGFQITGTLPQCYAWVMRTPPVRTPFTTKELVGFTKIGASS